MALTLIMKVPEAICGSDVVPVGRDQMQHVEIAADIAKSFNHIYGHSFKFKVPQAVVPDAEAGCTLPGWMVEEIGKSTATPFHCSPARLSSRN